MESETLIKEVGPSTLEMKLNGIVDEEISLPMDFDFSNYKKLFIDFSDVTFINSGGIKVWVVFSENINRFKDLKVYYQNCNRMIVDQINKTVGFLGSNTEVLSVYLPVFCNRCESTFNVLQEAEDETKDANAIFSDVGNPRCGEFPACQKFWELDFSNTEFFRFKKRKA